MTQKKPDNELEIYIGKFRKLYIFVEKFANSVSYLELNLGLRIDINYRLCV